MAMNFWEAQRRARSRTRLYLTLFLLLTLFVGVLIEFGMHYFVKSYDPPLPYVGLIFMGITICSASVQYIRFQLYGGAAVAESVGAVRVAPASTHPKLRKLLNSVEEIAVASSLPVPPVYVLPVKQINAFAAGLTKEDAAITVTEGTLALLNRDELQGVIAHEFGHIYNGDMIIGMRLAAMCMGFFFVLYFALRFMQYAHFRRRDDRDERERGVNPVLIGAFILIVAGAFTWFFGSLLKAAVSREREYLADACAVQFTRNPDGIANALRKIAAENDYDEMPNSGIAFTHLYFDDRGGLSSLFATHPPIKKRIEAIEAREYLPEEWKAGLEDALKNRLQI
ncbi:MAG: M48 family metalloprotease [Parachlamydiaceae bacterium]